MNLSVLLLVLVRMSMLGDVLNSSCRGIAALVLFAWIASATLAI